MKEESNAIKAFIDELTEVYGKHSCPDLTSQEAGRILISLGMTVLLRIAPSNIQAMCEAMQSIKEILVSWELDQKGHSSVNDVC